MSTTPAVIMVPGLVHHRPTWTVLERMLRRAGFEHIATVADRSQSDDVLTLADHLARHVDVMRTLCNVERVHLIGHNLGGIACRWFVQVLDGDRCVDTVVTVGTPHRGSEAAFKTGAAFEQLQPGSFVMRRLEATTRPTPVRWLNYLSGRDLLVQPSPNGLIPAGDVDVTNMIVPDHGDLSLTIPPAVRRSITHRLATRGFGELTDPLFTPDPAAAVQMAMARHPSTQTAPLRLA